MAKKTKRKLLFITVLLTILLSSSAYATLIPNAHAANITIQQKGLTIINDAVGLDLTRYTTIAKKYPQDSYFGVVPEENVGYNLESDESKLKLLCTFTGGALHILHVLEREGSPHMTKSATNVIEMTKDFLGSYQSYSGNTFYWELASMLDRIDANKNLTKTSGNIKLEATITAEYTTFEWSYTFDGVNAASKCVALCYKNGFLKYFVDTWNLYPVGSTAVNLSEAEAVAIAMGRAKTFSWKVVSGNETFEINNFNVTEVIVKQLVFGYSFNADNSRSEDLLTLYPMWRIGVALDKFYPGNVYGIYVDIWADTKEIRRVQAVFSTLPPPADKIATIDESAVGALNGEASFDEAKTNSMPITWLAFPAFAGVLLGTAPFWLGRKKNLPSQRSLKIGVTMFLVLTLLLLVPTATVGAVFPEPKGRATIWGSLAAPKVEPEPTLQDQVCQYIHSNFSSNGYVSSDYQGSYTLKNNALSSIGSGEANYHRAATVWFDHGIGNKLTLGSGHEDEWHFMLCDSTTPNEDPMDGYIYDYEIHERTGLEKTFFAFISTCMSAKLDLINPLNGQPLGNGSYGYNNGIPIGMPYAWTHGVSVSTDGYANPDTGPFCYIGFPWGSAALALDDLDPAYPSVRYYDWVQQFFYHALTYDMSVNNALDHASIECFNKYFGSTALHLNFSAIWPGVWGGEPFPNCTMVVYGNGNIYLYQYSFTVLAEDQDEYDLTQNPTKDVYIDNPYNIAETGATIKMNRGEHTLFTNDFWEAGYTGYRYYFQYYSVNSNYYSNENPLYETFTGDMTLTAHFNKAYCPGDVDGDGDFDEADSACFDASYSSARGDYSYKYDSRCDFNNDGYVNQGDYSYITSLITLAVPAYDQCSSPVSANVYVDSKQIGTTGRTFGVPSGSHTIEVSVPSGCTFEYYTYDSTTDYNNPATVSVTSDMTVVAHYYVPRYWLTVNAIATPGPDNVYADAWIDSSYVGTWSSTQVQIGYYTVYVPEWVWDPAAMFNTFYIEPGDYYDSFQAGSGLYGVTVAVTGDTTVTAIYYYQ